MKRLIIVSLVFIPVCLGLISCEFKGNETAFKAENGVTASPKDEVLVINLAVNDTYCKQTACACIHDIAAREYFDLQKELKANYNIDLKLTYFMESYEMEDALKEKKFDGVITKPWTAFMLSEPSGINYKRIADVLDVNNNQWLTGAFLVRKDSDIKTIEDIKGRTLVAGQEDAYEKYHLPFYILDEKKIEPKQIYLKASCLECLNELMDNNADVAVVSDYVLQASCAVDVASEDDFRVIGHTSKTPLCSVILDMAKVSEADALRLQAALLNVSGEALENMLSDGFVKPASWIPNPYLKPLANN